MVYGLIRLCLFGPEVNIESGIFGQFYSVPVLGRAGGKVTSVDHQCYFWLVSLFVSKTIISDCPFHHAELTEHTGRRIVMAE